MVGSEQIVIGKMLHDILDPASQNIAKPIKGIDLNILIVAQPIELRTIYIVMGVQVILGNALAFHGFP